MNLLAIRDVLCNQQMPKLWVKSSFGKLSGGKLCEESSIIK